MENFDRENIDKLLENHQICQYFPIKILRHTVCVNVVTISYVHSYITQLWESLVGRMLGREDVWRIYSFQVFGK